MRLAFCSARLDNLSCPLALCSNLFSAHAARHVDGERPSTTGRSLKELCLSPRGAAPQYRTSRDHRFTVMQASILGLALLLVPTASALRVAPVGRMAPMSVRGAQPRMMATSKLPSKYESILKKADDVDIDFGFPPPPPPPPPAPPPEVDMMPAAATPSDPPVESIPPSMDTDAAAPDLFHQGNDLSPPRHPTFRRSKHPTYRRSRHRPLVHQGTRPLVD